MSFLHLCKRIILGAQIGIGAESNLYESSVLRINVSNVYFVSKNSIQMMASYTLCEWEDMYSTQACEHWESRMCNRSRICPHVPSICPTATIYFVFNESNVFNGRAIFHVIVVVSLSSFQHRFVYCIRWLRMCSEVTCEWLEIALHQFSSMPSVRVQCIRSTAHRSLYWLFNWM